MGFNNENAPIRALVLDIETLASPDAADFMEPVSAPSNYKDEAKIEAYIAERRTELLSKCALDPDLCTVAAVGYAYDDCDEVYTANAFSEAEMLSAIWDQVRHSTAIVGFNILAFDLPVLIRRSQYLGVPMPSLNLDRYRTPHVDLMERLSFNGKLRFRGLDFYCKRFGVTVPDAHSGKDIDALVTAGEWGVVADHCRADVKKTYALAVRLGYMQSRQPVGAF